MIGTVTVQLPGAFVRPVTSPAGAPSADGKSAVSTQNEQSTAQGSRAATVSNVETSPSETNSEGLTEEEEAVVRDLKKRDQEVRAHEQAHKTVGGPYASAPSYETVTGPDGREYAVGGEVKIDASPVQGNPAATIRKMDIVIRAALAPANPSPQDTQVAQSAQQTKLQAQAELREQNAAERAERTGQDVDAQNAPLQLETAQGDTGNNGGFIDAVRAFIDAEVNGKQDDRLSAGRLLDIES